LIDELFDEAKLLALMIGVQG